MGNALCGLCRRPAARTTTKSSKRKEARTTVRPLESSAASSCTVCWEFRPRFSSCDSGHVICDGCLVSHVRAHTTPPQRLVESGGGIPCATIGCASPPWALEELAERLDKEAAVAFGVALRRVFVDAPAALAAAAAASARRDAEARALSIPARAREIVSIIAERDLWLRCPRCSAKYLDFSGCCALTCATNGCTICGVCLALHANDKATHAHFHAEHGGDIFDLHRVQAVHKERRMGLIITAVRDYAVDGRDLQRAVIRELAREEPVPGFRVDAALLMCSARVEMGAELDDPVALAAAAAAAALGTELLRAIAGNCVLEAVRLVSAGADANILDASGDTALFLALAKPLPDIVAAIISTLPAPAFDSLFDKAGRTALHVAVELDLSAVFDALIAKRVNLDAVDTRGRPPLHSALYLFKAEAAVRLIAAGASLRFLDNEGQTALVVACRLGLSVEALAMLAAPGGVDVNSSSNANGNTSLHWASWHCTPNVVAALLNKTANCNARNNANREPLGMAFRHFRDDNAVLLIAAGAHVGTNTLLWASQRGRAAVIPALLARGINVDACMLYPFKATALWLACKNKYEGVALLLIAAGANARLGSSCYRACNYKMPKVMAALLLAGADPSCY